MRLTKIFILLSMFTAIGCSDVIVPDIGNKQVQLVIPANGLMTSSRAQEFFWEPMKNAEAYNFRIASPSFDSISTFFLDSTISTNRLDLILPYGSYEWNIVGLNSAYSSACCQTFRLTIKNDSSANLSNQTLLLTTPSDFFSTNNPAINFDWQSLEGAETYLLQIGTPDFSTLLLEEELTAPGYNFTILNDGQYSWRVRAVNESSLTMTSWQQRSFVLDRTVPVEPELEFPANSDTIALDAQDPDLYWNSSLDIIIDSVFIYNNAQRDILLLQVETSSRELNLDGTSIDQAISIEDYYWEVRSVDKAGNISGKSSLQRFYVQ